MESQTLMISSLSSWTLGNLILSNVREKILQEDDTLPAALGAITGLALLILFNSSKKTQEFCRIPKQLLDYNLLGIPIVIGGGIVNGLGVRAIVERPQAIFSSIFMSGIIRIFQSAFAKLYASPAQLNEVQKFIILTSTTIPLDLTIRALYEKFHQPLVGAGTALIFATFIEVSRHYYHFRGNHRFEYWNAFKFSLPLIACVTLITALAIRFFAMI